MKNIKEVSLVTFLKDGVDGFVMFGKLFNFTDGKLTEEYTKLLTQEHVDAFKSRPDVFQVIETEEKPAEEVKTEDKKEELVETEVVTVKKETEEKKVEEVKAEKVKEVTVEEKTKTKTVEKPAVSTKNTKVK